MIEKEITGCIDCPFSYGYDMAVGSGCKIDDQNRDVQQKRCVPITPDWCPLKTESIIIKLKQS